ncbi:hypothetical protein C0Q70_01227 [Pomacea canaliculata]|uniref:Glycosyltransferase family 8 protein n=1 Tax=Pomacea canaliculata TaxID=400727 RepID=A0A2T7PYX0_POMCA|nr:hypothetical protein C0Q70_01227 [Pomacea canaliculata]
MDSTYRRLVDLDTVHVAIFADEKLFPGVVTLTNSIVSNTASPVTFHFVTFPSNATRLRLWITGSKLRNITFEIVELPINALEGKYRSRSPRKELSSPLNFARFYLQSLFPTVGKIIYIDSDCLVLELYNIQLSSDHPVSLLRICDLRRDKFPPPPPPPPPLRTYKNKKLNLTAKLIHWNGQRKPWMSCQSPLWNQYSVPDPCGRVQWCVKGVSHRPGSSTPEEQSPITYISQPDNDLANVLPNGV